MAEVTSHPEGAFSWPELATTDQKAAVTFYRGLFGWDVNESPISEGETYSMFLMRGKPVAAAYTMQADERKTGVPTHWNNYVTVKSADESVKKAQGLGANVFAAPFDVMDFGRMAVLQDPTGAVFQVWEPKLHAGASIINEPGALCWTELTTTDPNAAEKFYTQLLGWSAKHSAAGAPMAYTEFSVAGTPSIGMMEKPKEMPANIPSYWMPYFQVESVDSSADKAKQLGAQAMVPPTDIPNTGRFAIINDPQGGMFALFQRK